MVFRMALDPRIGIKSRAYRSSLNEPLSLSLGKQCSRWHRSCNSGSSVLLARQSSQLPCRIAASPDARTAAAQTYVTKDDYKDGDHLKGRFMIPATEVEQLLAMTGLSIDEFLFSLIKPASRLSQPFISGFPVGAVALGGSGSVYVGVNIEFPHTPLNNSIHAEQSLLVNCLHAGETSICALAVSEVPCGHCRQFYAEIKDADSLEYLFGRDARPKYLADLLPLRFGPADLQDEPFPLLLERQANPVAWHPEAEAALAGRAGDEAFQAAAAAALEEARKCYTPYTRCHAGAALVLPGGRVFSGGAIESAAYNPSLSPFHAAVVDAVTRGGLRSYGEIQAVVLAERAGCPVQHAAATRLVVEAVAPGAALSVLRLA